MKKNDELAFWNLLQATAREYPDSVLRAEAVADYFGIPTKRSEYLLSKWAETGLIDYGTSIRNVWLTPKGLVTEMEEHSVDYGNTDS